MLRRYELSPGLVMQGGADAAKPYCADDLAGGCVSIEQHAASSFSSCDPSSNVTSSTFAFDAAPLRADFGDDCSLTCAQKRVAAWLHIETDALNRDPLSTVHVAWAARLGGASLVGADMNDVIISDAAVAGGGVAHDTSSENSARSGGRVSRRSGASVQHEQQRVFAERKGLHSGGCNKEREV